MHNYAKHYSQKYPQTCRSPLTFQEAFVQLIIGGETLSPDRTKPVIPANGVQAQALHINGLTQHCDQTHNYSMNCNPCAWVANLKAISKDKLKVVGPKSTTAYSALNFTEVDTGGGSITWRHLLIRLDITNISHR
jgi:hypothetical protein